MCFGNEIKVIVKTPAQKTEDQTIQCNLNWTVAKLKNEISEKFPLKPAVNEQRLIYSGHLLKDECTLKEVFRPTEHELTNSTFTLHLVFSPKDSKEIKSDVSSNCNVETNNQSSANSTNQSNPNLPNINISQFSFNLTNDSSVDFTNLYVQQMQQYQQMYVNYMVQFLNNNNNLEQPQTTTNVYNNLPIMNPMFFNPFLNLSNSTNFTPLINSSSSTNTLNDSSNSRPIENEPVANENVQDNEAEVQNNWLDMINMFWNFFILLLMLSASLSRALFVFACSLIYYLYQTGFFSGIFVRLFGGGNNVNNNINRNRQPNNEEQIQQMMDDNVEIHGLRRRHVNNEDVTDANTDINNNQQHFVLNKFRFFWMIISSLFSSLMPHNDPLVPAN